MRIIDKNHDYYDYLQDPTDTLVFDRRGSFILEKSYVCDAMGRSFLNGFDDLSFRHFDDITYRHLLLQCGATFWVFLLTTTKIDKTSPGFPVPADYDIELLATWKNYNKPNKLLDIRLINFRNNYLTWDYTKKSYVLNRDRINSQSIQNSVDSISEFTDRNSYYLGSRRYTVSKKIGWEDKYYTIPLLSACGIANVVDPLDVFCAIEEYFSIEKTKSERTEPIGTTNNDKIITHGFDTKTSFRGR